ncbi:MAG: phosphomannomutase/phosphoglucomutase [Bdellovibrionales bacterium]|nr:phosphomannomutase/phosphoglucomutase [Bdellovibrionales bacterium]
MFSSSIFRANDIRGVYNKDFNLEFCGPLAKALKALLAPLDSSVKILIGHDSRLSSPELAASLSAALQEEGVDTALAGLAPSPLCYFLLHHYRFSAVVVVTASHNPKDYNGFKVMVHRSLNVPDSISSLKKILHHQSFPSRSGKKGKEFSVDIYTPYISSLKKEFSLKPLPFAVDAGNGAAGPLAKKVFKAFHLSPSYLFCEPDGHFPNHHPDPTVERNLSTLKKEVLDTKSLFGVGWDGDGDRVSVMTGKGRFLFGDELGFLFLPSLLSKKNSSKKIIVDVKCSHRLLQCVEDFGGEVILSKSGHRFARRVLETYQALFAVEFSGHIFFNDRPDRGFDDGLYATLRLIELLNNNPDLESLLPPSNPFRTDEIRLPFSPSEIKTALDCVKNYLQNRGEKFNSLDGVRFTRGKSWALFRDSKTQNVLSMMFEAKSQKELDLLKNEFSRVMKIQIP